jgi:hypothetical protein
MNPRKDALKKKAHSLVKMGFDASENCLVTIKFYDGTMTYVDLSATASECYFTRMFEAVYKHGKTVGVNMIKNQLQELLINDEF